jgi:thioester reductase-like protein
MAHSSIHNNDPLSSTAWITLRADLRNFAGQHLPQAAVPSQFIVMPELPKLANGKVDRKRLPAARRDLDPERLHTPPETPQEIRIASIWVDLLSLSRVGLHDDFFELGGNSLTAAQMAARVRAVTGTVINLRRFFENPTLAGLVELLGGQPQKASAQPRHALSISAEELLAEARLPEDIFPDPHATATSQAPYRAIFLTGGSGYTGAYLMRELLDRSDAHLFVLVRADGQYHAQQRIRTTMDRFGLWREDAKERITPIVGDLARPYFGVDRATYVRLARQAEVIIHNGALSSYAMSYHTLKPVNVLGTQEVLRLACRERIKPVHYVSSLAVYPSVPGHRWAELEVTESERVTGGYVQTKWVGDSMHQQASRRGVPCCVYRPGLITGARETGACETDTFINAGIKGCIQLGAVPTGSIERPLEIVPVDFFAAALAHIALSGKALGSVFNLPGARTMTSLELHDRLDEHGYSLRRRPYSDWYRELTAAIESGKQNELARFLPVFDEMNDQEAWPASPVYETTNLESALSGSGIVCAAPDKQLWERYLNWFIATGFLPTPEAAFAANEAAAGTASSPASI